MNEVIEYQELLNSISSTNAGQEQALLDRAGIDPGIYKEICKCPSCGYLFEYAKNLYSMIKH